jgi:6-phosphogluconolactonase
MTRRLFLAAAMFVMATASQAAPKYWVFIGTQTGGKSASKGIHLAEFDPATGKLGDAKLAAEVTSPTFLAIHPTKNFLYSIGEVNMMNGKKAGGVHAFAVDPATGKLTKLNDSDSGGPGPAHLCVDRKGDCLIVANYGGGSVKCLKLKDDGSIGTESSFHQHSGGSVNLARQKEPHTHSANVSPDNRFAVLADLGMDKLMVYKLDSATAQLTPNEPAFFAVAPGAGPRHFAWHPNGKWAYTNGELDFTVTAMKFDNGTFTKLNVSPTLPADTPETIRKKNSTAEILVHPNGKYVLCSNRGHNSLAVFKVGDDGSLTPSGHITGEINVPRNFTFDPTGRWILVANQEGNSVTVFDFDAENGTAKQVESKISVPRPMCIRFVEKK